MQPTRISELHKGAFWIFGVTALVMHDPAAHVLPRLFSAGITNWEVCLELWRCAVLLILMARFFLAAGLYFDEVYMRESSAERFPRKSYAVDFMAGLLQFLLYLAGAVTVASHLRLHGEFAPFMVVTAVILLYENVWYAASLALGFSTSSRIGESCRYYDLALVCGAGIYAAARLAGDPVFADQVVCLALLGFTAYDMSQLVRKYNTPDAARAQAAR